MIPVTITIMYHMAWESLRCLSKFATLLGSRGSIISSFSAAIKSPLTGQEVWSTEPSVLVRESSAASVPTKLYVLVGRGLQKNSREVVFTLVLEPSG